jgi:predicted amidohydrolase
MKIGLIQMDIKLGDVNANRRKAENMIREAVRRGSQLLVLPELWTTGYQLEEILNLAEGDNGPTLAMLSELARVNRVEIIAGSLAEKEGSKVYNSSYVVGNDGAVVAKYRKIHLIGLMDEDRYLTAGRQKCMYTGLLGNTGLMICYDLRFTELPRALALAGCTSLVIPAEWPAARGQHWLTLNMARAIENQAFVMAVNRVGSDKANTFFGHSMVVNPWGEVLAMGSAENEEVIIAEVDSHEIDNVRQSMPVFADRRPDCYK